MQRWKLLILPPLLLAMAVACESSGKQDLERRAEHEQRANSSEESEPNGKEEQTKTAQVADSAAAEEADAPKMSAMDRQIKIAELTQDMLQLATKGEDDQALQAALGALEQAHALHRKLGERAARKLSDTNYNVACMYSRMKRLDESFDYLHASIKLVDFGENRLRQIEQDPDFDNIRGDPRYAELIKKADRE